MMRKCQGCGAPLVMAIRCAYCGTVAAPPPPPDDRARELLRSLVRDLEAPELVAMLSLVGSSSPRIASLVTELVADVRKEEI